jgi:hypothetical protein
MLLLLALVIGYALIAVVTKSYYNIYRHTDADSPEEPYFAGIFWPLYLTYRLLAWPFMTGSAFLEKKIVSVREKKEKAKTRICCSELPDPTYIEAEQEVESMLLQKEERSLEL